MALTVTLLRAESQRSCDPAEVLRSVNNHLLQMNQTGMFVTILYGVINCRTKKFKYARAGHELPLVVDIHGKIYHVQKQLGQPMALFPDLELDEGVIHLPSDGLLMLYTDGATDAVDETGLFFGSDRLLRIMQSEFQLSAQNLCNIIWDEIEAFRGNVIQHDDVTLVMVKMFQDV